MLHARGQSRRKEPQQQQLQYQLPQWFHISTTSSARLRSTRTSSPRINRSLTSQTRRLRLSKSRRSNQSRLKSFPRSVAASSATRAIRFSSRATISTSCSRPSQPSQLNVRKLSRSRTRRRTSAFSGYHKTVTTRVVFLRSSTLSRAQREAQQVVMRCKTRTTLPYTRLPLRVKKIRAENRYSIESLTASGTARTSRSLRRQWRI